MTEDEAGRRASAERRDLSESLIRLEAKIDVILSQHEGKIDDLTRRQGETTSTLRDHDMRITANALTVAETRAQAAQAQLDVKSLRNDVSRDVSEAKQQVADSKPKNIPVWIAVGISALAVVISPILTALMTR